MDDTSGKGSKMQAHMRSSVVMDVAAVKVSHSVGIDEDATALRAVKARSSSIHRDVVMDIVIDDNTASHVPMDGA